MQKKTNRFILIAGAALVSLVLFAGCSFKNEESPAPVQTTAAAQTEVKGDAEGLTIPVSDLTDKPQFFAYNADGKDMEIIALTASDGSIRTSFNTCQVCYSSGRGYYKVKGDSLVCQNCGNTFGFDDIAVTRGGCNPVPITEKERADKDDNIVITASYLKDASILFENWK